MEGRVLVTDLSGGFLFDANIWVLVSLCVYSRKLHLDLSAIRVFIDDEEIPKPESLKDPT